ncbi:MAG: hypothetical protein P9M14_17340 [Candidatus Alcyoniella australis]|nr:hypothetical protein [Candidatus Alcyoniella australis]
MRAASVVLATLALCMLVGCGEAGPKTPAGAVEAFMAYAITLSDPDLAAAATGSAEAEQVARARKDFPNLFIDEKSELFFSDFYTGFRPTSYEIVSIEEGGGTAKIGVSMTHIENVQVGVIRHQQNLAYDLYFIAKRQKSVWRLTTIQGWPPPLAR